MLRETAEAIHKASGAGGEGKSLESFFLSIQYFVLNVVPYNFPWNGGKQSKKCSCADFANF